MKQFSSHLWCPPAMKVQLNRLFGPSSPAPLSNIATATEWRRTLRKLLRELERYLNANVETDAVHRLMLHSGLAAAEQSLNQDSFWPGYAEGITRLALLLMGDYPDHRKRLRGRRRGEHYRLSRSREVRFLQTPVQRLNTLLAAPHIGIQLKTSPGSALAEFHRQFGSKAGLGKFFAWYRRNHPEDYAALF